MISRALMPVLSILLIGVLASCTSSTSPGSGGGSDQFLIGYYPLDSTPNDTLGKLGPMVLTNTPFQDGGIYCNGVYINSADTVNRCQAITPKLDSLDFRAFTVTARFKINEIKSPPVNGRPIIVGGAISRWMGVIIRPDTTLSFLYNNSTTIPTGVRCPLDAWHDVGMSYDSATHTGKLFFDGTMIASDTAALQPLGGRDVSITNFGTGTTFLGYLADLKIYNSSDAPVATNRYRQYPEW